MKLIVLGSGTSTGVPRIGNDWGACDPNEPKNRRSRVSIIVESDEGMAGAEAGFQRGHYAPSARFSK